MENIDLDIENYDLNDILHLFKLKSDFSESDLKKAKQVVLKIHPDKSKLPPQYFIFYSKAYKMLYNIYEFRNKSTNKKGEENYAPFSSNEKKAALDVFMEKNNLKDKNNFNSWFNKQFEKTKIASETETKGYGDWLRSDDDIEEERKMSQSEMAAEFAKKKQQARSLVVHQDINDMYMNNIGASSLSTDAPSEYSSDLFSHLSYQDLKQAHCESVIPVTDEDYAKVKKFNNVNEYMSYRSNQDTKPLSEKQAFEYLQNKSKMDDQQASKRAYELAKQTEEAEKQNQTFWGNILRISNT